MRRESARNLPIHHLRTWKGRIVKVSTGSDDRTVKRKRRTCEPSELLTSTDVISWSNVVSDASDHHRTNRDEENSPEIFRVDG
jgi:hypothetical protein